MTVIGITGSIGTGKSTVAKIIKSLGYPVIDCDEVNHNLLRKTGLGYQAVLSAFGTAILDSNLEIDRKKLGSIVFNDEAKRLKLNSLLHPLVKNEVQKAIEENTRNLFFMECPLLFETDFYLLCDYTVVVYTDLDHQIWRVMKRDGIDFPTALKRIYAQAPLEEKMNKADFVIDNCHDAGDLLWQVKQMILKIERK